MLGRSLRLMLPLFVFSILPLRSQPAVWTSVGIGGGGALFNPSISPHKVDEIFVSCDMTEIFHTTNFGRQWSTLDFRQIETTGAYGRMEFTSDPRIIYTLGLVNDGGVPYQTNDRGVTWNPIPSDPTAGDAWNLVADPNRTDRIVVSDYSTLFLSTDAGASWSQRYKDTTGNGCYIAGAYFDADTVYIGIGQGLLISRDGGATFQLNSGRGIPSDEAIVSFCGSGSGSSLRLYAVTLGSGDVYPGVTGADAPNFRGLYTMWYNGPSWVSHTSQVPQGFYPYFVSCARSNPSIAYVAGGSANSVPIVLKTSDSGGTWRSVLTTTNNGNVATGWSGDGGDRGWWYGEYALGFNVCPTDPNRVIITDLGFPHVTTDGGASWRQAYVDSTDEHAAATQTPQRRYYHGIGIENTTSWRVAWLDSLTMLGCFSDIRGIRSSDGGASWSFDYSGHTLNSMYYALKHPSNGTTYAAVSSVHDMYQSTYLQDARIDAGSGGVISSTDNGRTWSPLHDFEHPVIWIALDPMRPNRMYASVIHSSEGGIYVSDNIDQGLSSTWRKLATPPRTEGHAFNIKVLNDGTLVCSYSGRRNGPGAFTASSGVFVSTDQGNTWADRSDAGMRYWTKDVVIDPHDATQNTWYVGVFSGWGGPPNGLGGLYRTTDRGVTWKRIAERDRVTSLTIDPTSANVAYMTTETDGLQYTSNLNDPNPAFTPVASYPFRQPERVFFNPYRKNEIWVTSFGNGLRRGTVTASGVQIDPDVTGPMNLR